MKPKSVIRRKRRQALFRHLQEASILILMVVLVFKLGNMQLEGLPTIVAASLAIVIAFTSLMYNRARAVSNRRTRFRSLVAAELGLRSTLFAIVGTAFVALVFPYLTGAGYVQTVASKYPTQIPPFLASLAAIGFFCPGLFLFLAAVRVLSPMPFDFPRASRISRTVGPD